MIKSIQFSGNKKCCEHSLEICAKTMKQMFENVTITHWESYGDGTGFGKGYVNVDSKILNLTLCPASDDQVEVIEVSRITDLLKMHTCLKEIPSIGEIKRKAIKIAAEANHENCFFARLDGIPGWLIPDLEYELTLRGITPVYEVKTIDEDGKIHHIGWIKKEMKGDL